MVYLILDKTKFAEGVNKNDIVKGTETDLKKVLDIIENSTDKAVVKVTIPRNPRTKVSAVAQ